MQSHVLITGIGPLSPRAASRLAFWKLLRGLDHPAVAAEPTAQTWWLQLPDAFVARRALQLQDLDPLGRLAAAAAEQAIADAELDLSDEDPRDVGLALASGGSKIFWRRGTMGAEKPRTRTWNAPAHGDEGRQSRARAVCAVEGIGGPSSGFASGGRAGLDALACGFDQVAAARVHTAVVDSADRLDAELVASFARRGDLSPTGVPRPFDRRRDGTLLSEGACALVLEELHAARCRGAPLYAELVSVGGSVEPTSDASHAVAAGIRDALQRAGLRPTEVDVVFSSASGSVNADAAESRGLIQALGDHARRVPVTCPKSLLSETLGSAGMFAVAMAALALSSGWVPATAHYEEPDPDCRLNIQGDAAQQLDPAIALVSVLGDHGRAGAAVLRRCG